MACFYKNTQIFNGKELVLGQSLVVENNKTIDVITDSHLPAEGEIIDLGGGILSPGYVEVQANGGGGVLFNDEPNVAGLKTILKAHRQFGTVAMLPTFITDTQDKMFCAIKAIEQGLNENIHGLIGGHFEGPFLNVEKKGTHLPSYIRKPEEKDLNAFLSHNLGHSLITLAPENVEPSFIEALSKGGFCISAGHSIASKQDMIRAYKHGLNGVTHLYNAMPPLQGRDPSIIGSAVGLDLYSGIITDGIHSDAFSLQLAYRAFGAKRLMIVTDSMHTIGAEDIKEFWLTGQKVFVHEDRLVNEHGALAGAHITMEQSVKNAVSLMEASVEDALNMAITTPASFLNRLDLSSILDRDLKDVLWLDDALNIRFLTHD